MERYPSASFAPPAEHKPKNILLDFLWRFLLVYFFLSDWVWLNELAVNPTRPIHPVFNAVFGSLARWTGHHLFHLTGPLAPNSFRDTQYLYLVLLVLAVTSAVAALLWTAFGRKGHSAQTAYRLLRIWIRYTLAYMILIYAMDKVFRLQFIAPTLQRLIEPYGDSSPMAMLWTYVGYSGFMTVFSGLAEVLGAVLLLWRRTAPLGALVCVVMMANVALMDFCYDVSVKMLAAHFLAMSVFLLAHDADRLLRVLTFNSPAPARDLEKDELTVTNPSVRRWLPLVKALIVIYTLVPVTVRTYIQFRHSGPFAPHPPFYGLYQVRSLTVNGTPRPLLVTDGPVWRWLIVEHRAEATIKTMDNTLIVCKAQYHADAPDLQIQGTAPGLSSSESDLPGHGPSSSASDASPLSLTLSPSPSQHGEMLLTGTDGSDKISAVLDPVDPRSFTLVNRGYHWINATSFSR
ncbi:hypothetical protein [Paracidobacterium acidisoli]|uniref:DoxX family protein n=1 Tax=Paracidobacterium acidisoli TaxID=2303751 RepID=A0A372IPV2_9BACT|nr:hypothetical protein [Paracidobacterium acidisoli]MBT9331098.1 hypothetical protein [Paracidobacterium acidisoli]